MRQAAAFRGTKNYPSLAKPRTSAPELTPAIYKRISQSLLPGQTDAVISHVTEPDTGPSPMSPALFSQLSIPDGRPARLGPAPFLTASSTLPPVLQSHLSISSQPPTPPITSSHQQPFFSQLSVTSGSSQHNDSYRYRADSFALQLGHRRMRKISRSDLENMQWEKKQQPARRMA